MTEKLFWLDSYQTEFEAKVLEQFPVSDGIAAVLDRTCFYATSGGQPNDLGSLNGQAIKDVRFEGEKLLHIIAAPLDSQTVAGKVDEFRRTDHRQQHSGQHILSAAFYNLFAAETSSFHLGEAYCSIELNRPGLTEAQIKQAQDAANHVIFAGTTVTTFFIDPGNVAEYALRKQPDVGENLRIIQVGDFDRSPCSGTHVKNAAEVGLVFVTGSEKISNGTKVSFLCGNRVVLQYQKDLASLKELSKLMTTSFDLLPDSVRNLQNQVKELRKENMQMKEGRLKAEAMKMLMNSEPWNGHHLMVAVWARPYQEIRYLAQKLSEQAGAVGAFVSSTEKRAVFFRNPKLPLDLKSCFQQFVSRTSAKGGGAPHFLEAGNLQEVPDLNFLKSLFV